MIFVKQEGLSLYFLPHLVRLSVYLHSQNLRTLNKKINIAIDGYSSCGKSTIAKSIARELNYIYIDTGAMYRAIALYALQNAYVKNDLFDVHGLVSNLDNIYITFKYNVDLQISETFLNTKNVEKEIRSMDVAAYVSKVSNIKEVRAKLVRLQQRMAKNGGVVMDGRDIGTVVLPDAALKFFMTADPEVRAQRRYQELLNHGVEVSFEEVSENVKSRDYLDSHRDADPLRQAKDAIILDNTNLSIDEQFDFVMGKIYNFFNSEKKTEVTN